MKFKLLASALLAFSFCAHAQIFGGSTPARRVVNSSCTNGQTGTYDANGRFTGCASAGGATNVSATSASAVTSLAIDVSSLNLANLNSVLVQCWSGTAAPFSPVTVTSLNPATTSSITANFSSTANVTCRANSSGGAGPAGATGPTGATGAAGANGTNGVISEIQNQSSTLPPQPIIDFQGAGVTASNGSGKTIVTIPGGGSASDGITISNTSSTATLASGSVVTMGNVPATLGTDCVATVTSGTGSVFSYFINGQFLIGGNVTATASGCSAAWVPAITAYPAGSIPIATWTVTAGVVATGVKAPLVRGQQIVAGTNVTVSYGSDGAATVSATGGSSVTYSAPYMVIGGTSYYAGQPVTLPPSTGSWANLISGSAATFTATAGGALSLVSSTAATQQAKSIALGSTRTLTAAFVASGSTGDLCKIGVIATGGAQQSGAMVFLSDASTDGIYTQRLTSSLGFSAILAAQRPRQVFTPIWVRIALTGSNIVFSTSSDGGLTFSTVHTDTQSNVLGQAVTNSDLWYFGVIGTGSASSSCTLLSWSAS